MFWLANNVYEFFVITFMELHVFSIIDMVYTINKRILQIKKNCTDKNSINNVVMTLAPILVMVIKNNGNKEQNHNNNNDDGSNCDDYNSKTNNINN